jgi:hypothetical protein
MISRDKPDHFEYDPTRGVPSDDYARARVLLVSSSTTAPRGGWAFRAWMRVYQSCHLSHHPGVQRRRGARLSAPVDPDHNARLGGMDAGVRPHDRTSP